ncbi:MAG: hypothetical protein Kow0032_07330 [Methyloligellaceae bacterium]
MASKREEVLQALFAVLEGISGPKVLRNENLPERIPSGGLIILRDGDPGEPEVLMSPLNYVYDHFAEAEVLIDAPTPAARDAAFDAVIGAIGTAVAQDRTLGGLCDYVRADAPAPVDLIVEGAPGFKAAVVPIVLTYGTADPLG